jgi:NADPH-dependent ferric siderophore reductase
MLSTFTQGVELNAPNRRIERVRHELRIRDVQVSQVDRLGPNFVSVTFAGPDLADFRSDSFDDHVKFIVPGTDGEPVRRDYTPRRFDAQQQTLTIEFALHGQGAASDWARQAAVGQAVTIGGPRGSMIVPLDYDWHLLVGDDSALPAIHRRLEELPVGVQARALVLLGHEDDRRELKSQAALDVQWFDTPEALTAAVQTLSLPQGEGFVWCAGEASLMTRLRTLLLEGKGHPKEAMKVAAYWKPGASDYHEKLES